MSRRHITVLAFLTAIVGVAVGFLLGAREGSHLAQIAVGPPRGALAARVLVDLKAGQSDAAKIVFESEVDRGLFDAYELLDSPSRQLTGTLVGIDPSYSLDNYLTRLANYRKANPSPFKGEFAAELRTDTPEQRAFAAETTQRNREGARIIDLMVQRYATK